MTHTKYIVNPFRMDEEEENEPKNDKEEHGFMAKKMEKLFFEKRAVYLWGVVDDRSAKDIVGKLLLLDADKPGEEIKFYINSPGGSVTSGMVMYDTIRLIQSPVSTICMGLAASMGSILLSAGVKGKRSIYPHGEVMIHQPSNHKQMKPHPLPWAIVAQRVKMFCKERSVIMKRYGLLISSIAMFL